MFIMIAWKLLEQSSDREFWLSRFVYKADCLAHKIFTHAIVYVKKLEALAKHLVLYTLPSLLWKLLVLIKRWIDRFYYELLNFMRGKHDLNKKGPVSSFLKNISEYRNNLTDKE